MDCKINDFSLNSDITYLNCAFMSPQLKRVEKAGIKGLTRKSNPHNITADHFFGETEELRKAFAQLINANDPKRTVVIPSVSYGMANVANNIPLSAGDEIIVADEQFPSNIYPWIRIADSHNVQLKTITPPENFENRSKIWNERILESITPKTKLVALAHVHWADGTLFDLKSIRKRTNEVGAWMVIDGTQSVGALPFDVQDIKPDALICAGYKWLLGPYSIGMAYYGPAMDDGIPIEENWINRDGSEDFTNLVNYNNAYQDGALRYEVGEHSNFIMVPMLLESIYQLIDWKPQRIQDYCKDLIKDSVSALKENGYRIEQDQYRASHLFGVRSADPKKMDAIKAALDENNILVSIRGNSIRVSPHVYNSKADMEHLTETLIRCVA